MPKTIEFQTMIQCNHPGCNEHSAGLYRPGEFNCGRHTPATKPQDTAHDIIRDALIEFGGRMIHAEGCRAAAFQKLNRHCPANHPIWSWAPECDCIIGRMAEWLKNQ
jgi:hypothetical protein